MCRIDPTGITRGSLSVVSDERLPAAAYNGPSFQAAFGGYMPLPAPGMCLSIPLRRYVQWNSRV